jgi:hypothetical protein
VVAPEEPAYRVGEGRLVYSDEPWSALVVGAVDMRAMRFSTLSVLSG